MSDDQKPLNIALFYKEGSSDKEYRVELRQEKDGLWSTLGFNGRRGSALKEQKKTPVPVDYDTARAVYDKTVKGKMKDGYTPDESGAIYQSTGAREFSGFVPQLLNTIRTKEELKAVMDDDDWVAQEKHDGERRPIVIGLDAAVTGLNKEGLTSSLPVNVVAAVQNLPANSKLDGEIIGERYIAFDLLELAGVDLRSKPYLDRLAALEGLALQGVETVVTFRGKKAKQALFDALRGHGSEGLVFKLSTAPYNPARPASGGTQLKLKFIETCTVRVASAKADRRSINIECLSDDAQSTVSLGAVTVPPSIDVPASGALVNVDYLYRNPGGSLIQPVLKAGVRTDQSAPDRLAQFKLKSDIAFDPTPLLANAESAKPAKPRKK